MATATFGKIRRLWSEYVEEAQPDQTSTGTDQPKFNTLLGVYIPSVLTILGVIMYLRMGWVVGNVGLFLTFLIVTLSSAVTFITGLSISSTATNMKVGPGGAYFMISRSFGIESGAAIGIPLFMAQAIGISFYIEGFSESLAGFLPFPTQVTGFAVLVIITALAYLSAKFALKTQLLIFAVVIASLMAVFAGNPVSEYNPDIPQKALFTTPFWTVFAVFFPAVTGILSGISMSGDLKNPSRSIPVGTISAVITGYIIYLAIPWFMWYSAPVDQLVNDSMVLGKIARPGSAIYIGIWGATLSSALGSMLAAPRTLKALADDQVLPRILGRVSDTGSPTTATVITFMVAAACIALGDLNLIAPILTMFFLTTYGILNLIAGAEGLVGSPTWRPTFKMHWLVSFAGAMLCFGIMLMINAGATYVAILVCTGLYFWVKRRELNVGFSDMRPSMLLYSARNAIYQLEKFEISERSWRPNMVLVSGMPQKNPYLLELATTISNNKGFTTLGVAISQEVESLDDLDKIKASERVIEKWSKDRHMPALVKLGIGLDDVEFTKQLLNFYGLGSIRPNLYVYDFEEDFDLLQGCLQLVYKQKRNAIVVRSNGLESLTEITERIKKPNINIWWGQLHESSALLMLTLAHLLRENSAWSSSNIYLNTIVSDDAEKTKSENTLGSFVKESRLRNIVPHLFERTDQKIPDIIRSGSKNADLTFMGLPIPDRADFLPALQHVMESTDNLGFTIYVLAGESVNLKRVFI